MYVHLINSFYVIGDVLCVISIIQGVPRDIHHHLMALQLKEQLQNINHIGVTQMFNGNLCQSRSFWGRDLESLLRYYHQDVE